MAPAKLKIKENKAFSLLSIETDEDLSKTWRLMTKVKDALEYGMRLENLAWRLWFMHHQMVHDPKSHTHFKKLSTATTKKLENEKANNIKDLAVPLYRPSKPKPQEIKGKKKLPKKNVNSANAGSQTKKKNAKNVRPVAESVSADVATSSTSTNNVNDHNAETNDRSQTDYESNNKIITPVDEQNNAELMELDSLDENMDLHSIGDMFRFSDVNQDFYLRQYTNDQDPYQVISLPGVFTRFDAHAILNPNNSQPTMMLELNDMMMRNHQFYSSSDSSEPTSPDGEWFSRQNSDMHAMQYQMNAQIVGRTSSAGLLHDAVYVRNDVVPGLTLSTSHDAHTPLNTPLNTPTTTNGNIMSGSNTMYMNQYSPEQNTNNTLGQQQQPSQGSSKSPITSPTSSQSSVDVPITGRLSTNNTSSASTSSTSENNKPKKAHSNGEQQCFNCGVTSTPLWRRSANDELLCNACGLYLKLHKMSRPKTMKPHIVRKDARDDEATQPVCSNCGTMTTPLWRRDEEGQTLCNACGLYFKLHHERRPLSMKTDVIKKRQRYENGQTPNRRGTKKQRANEIGQQESPPPPPPPPSQPPSQPPQSQQAQVMFNESNRSISVPTTTIGSISVGQSPTSGLAVCQSPTNTTSVNGGYQ